MGRFLPILLHKFESFLEKTLLGRHMPKQIWRQREAKRKLIERSNKLYKTTCRKVPKPQPTTRKARSSFSEHGTARTPKVTTKLRTILLEPVTLDKISNGQIILNSKQNEGFGEISKTKKLKPDLSV